MAQSGQFRLGLRLLTVLAADPAAMHTSAAIADELSESAVVIRRMFLRLQKAGLIEQKKGPNGGARLKLSAKQIGIGTLYAAVSEDWLVLSDSRVDAVMKKIRKEALETMNQTTLAHVMKKMKKR